MLNKLVGWRKVFVTLLCFGASLILLLTHNLSEDNFIEFNKWLLPSFMTAQLLERMVIRSKEKSSEG